MRTSAAYVTTIPGAELAYLHGAAHAIKDDQPAAYTATIRAFLAGKPTPHLVTNPAIAAEDFQHPHASRDKPESDRANQDLPA